MRFVPVKSAEKQASAIAFKTRDLTGSGSDHKRSTPFVGMLESSVLLLPKVSLMPAHLIQPEW
jgi:hypothetical protein